MGEAGQQGCAQRHDWRKSEGQRFLRWILIPPVRRRWREKEKGKQRERPFRFPTTSCAPLGRQAAISLLALAFQSRPVTQEPRLKGAAKVRNLFILSRKSLVLVCADARERDPSSVVVGGGCSLSAGSGVTEAIFGSPSCLFVKVKGVPGRARLLFAPLASHANLPVSLHPHQYSLHHVSLSQPSTSSRPLLSKPPNPPPPFFFLSLSLAYFWPCYNANALMYVQSAVI